MPNLKIIEFANRLDLDEVAHNNLLVHCMSSALRLIGILSGEVTLSIVSFASFINWWSTIKERNLLL